MSFFTPPNSPSGSPSRTDFQTPVRSGTSTPVHRAPSSPLAHAAQSLGRLFTEHAGSPATRPTTPTLPGTPGRVSAINDPTNHRVNDIHLFPKGLTTYRGDNSFKRGMAKHYSAQFFTFEKKVAANQYGKLVLKFKLQKDINLLRLDKNAEGFHHWLQNTDQFTPSEKSILYQNFGYPKNNSEGIGLSDTGRLRVSEGENDRAMLKMIQAYANHTEQQIDGYYNSTMANGALGNLKTEDGNQALFHAELAVFDGQVFGPPEMADKYTDEELKTLNLEAKRIQLEKQDRLARQSKRKRPEA